MAITRGDRWVLFFMAVVLVVVILVVLWLTD
jgi:hypothetical protein